MKFFREIFNNIIDRIKPILKKYYEKSAKFFWPKSSKMEDKVKYYHKSNVSVIIIKMEDYSLLEEVINFSFNKVEEHLCLKKLKVFNLIVKLQFVDDLNTTYNQSLTYKELFTIETIGVLKMDLVRDIHELLNQYKESTLSRIEIRVDYLLRR